VNARAVSGNQLAVAAGVDLPYISYAYHADGWVPAWEQHWDVHWIHEAHDLKTLLREGRDPVAAFQEWIRALRRADTFSVGAWDDPVRLLGSFAQIAFGRSLRTLGLRPSRAMRAVGRTTLERSRRVGM